MRRRRPAQRPPPVTLPLIRRPADKVHPCKADAADHGPRVPEGVFHRGRCSDRREQSRRAGLRAGGDRDAEHREHDRGPQRAGGVRACRTGNPPRYRAGTSSPRLSGI